MATDQAPAAIGYSQAIQVGEFLLPPDSFRGPGQREIVAWGTRADGQSPGQFTAVGCCRG